VRRVGSAARRGDSWIVLFFILTVTDGAGSTLRLVSNLPTHLWSVGVSLTEANFSLVEGVGSLVSVNKTELVMIMDHSFVLHTLSAHLVIIHHSFIRRIYELTGALHAYVPITSIFGDRLMALNTFLGSAMRRKATCLEAFLCPVGLPSPHVMPASFLLALS